MIVFTYVLCKFLGSNQSASVHYSVFVTCLNVVVCSFMFLHFVDFYFALKESFVVFDVGVFTAGLT